MVKIVQGCRDSRLDSWVTRDWQAAKVGIRVEHAGELKSHASCCTIGQRSQVDQAVSLRLNSRLSPVTRSSRQTTRLEKIDFSHSFLTLLYIDPYTHEMKRASRENFERETLEKTQDWFIHNLHIETLQIPLLSSSPLLNPWEGFLVLWEVVKKGPISY